MKVRRIEELNRGERKRLEEFLLEDRVFNSYLLCDLSSSKKDFEWYVCENNRGFSVAVKYRLPKSTFIFSTGNTGGLSSILEKIKFNKALISCPHEHLKIYLSKFGISSVKEMYKMFLSPQDFKPHMMKPARKVKPIDMERINDFYLKQGVISWHPSQLREGVYCCIEEGGKLICVAGTHCVSAKYFLAVLGNIYTVPEKRGRGYASSTVSFLLKELFKKYTLITLNVNKENLAAVRLYKKLGFKIHCTYAGATVKA